MAKLTPEKRCTKESDFEGTRSFEKKTFLSLIEVSI